MDLYLESKESELLQRLLAHRLEELHRAIHHTDRRAFKAELKLATRPLGTSAASAPTKGGSK